MQPRLDWNLQFCCLSLLSAGITDRCHYTQPASYFLIIKEDLYKWEMGSSRLPPSPPPPRYKEMVCSPQGCPVYVGTASSGSLYSPHLHNSCCATAGPRVLLLLIAAGGSSPAAGLRMTDSPEAGWLASSCSVPASKVGL